MSRASEPHIDPGGLATMHPAYFALVMATGIVSIALQLAGFARLPVILSTNARPARSNVPSLNATGAPPVCAWLLWPQPAIAMANPNARQAPCVSLLVTPDLLCVGKGDSQPPSSGGVKRGSAV
jgi:hypothetical protein